MTRQLIRDCRLSWKLLFMRIIILLYGIIFSRMVTNPDNSSCADEIGGPNADYDQDYYPTWFELSLVSVSCKWMGRL
ncbi:MAG: hypothetical protein IPJ64_06210 [Saprospiraceae bacterium]|nr:hypothetical protein [Saprospiraceae bacterium]MBK7795952.1 hypothetical protein [Saprospiraceae bacterium]